MSLSGNRGLWPLRLLFLFLRLNFLYRLWLLYGFAQLVGMSENNLLFVKDRVRKLLFEYVLLEELFDSHTQKGLSQNLIDRRPSPGIDGQHLVDQVPKLLTEMRRNRFELSSNDVHCQEMHIESLERRF